MDRKNQSDSTWLHMLAGGLSGVATSFVTAPLDVVKTRLQNQSIPLNTIGNNVSVPNFFNNNNIAGSNVAADTKFNPVGAGKYNGTVPSLWRIWKEEGTRGMYKGLQPTIIGYLPSMGIYFALYGYTKKIFMGHFENQTLVHLLSAVTASSVSTTVTNPLWVVRTRMMLKEKGEWLGTWSALKNLWAREQWRGLYSGLGPSLLGITHVAINFPIYERLKTWQHERLQSEQLGLVHILQCSMIAKICATLTTYPHEVLRTRVQNQRMYRSYLGVWGTAKRMLREEGLRSFYRGLPTTIMRVVPANAITFLTYEGVVAYLSSA